MRSLLVLAPLFLITFACQTTQTNTAQANVDYSHNYKYSYRNTHVKTIDQPILTNDGIEMLPNGVTQNDKSSFKQSAFELITHPSTGQLVKVTLIETRQMMVT